MSARFKGPIELILQPITPQGVDTGIIFLLTCKETNDWGTGTTVQEAYDDLMLTMEDIYRMYVLDNKDKLSEGAMELRQWLIDNVDVDRSWDVLGVRPFEPGIHDLPVATTPDLQALNQRMKDILKKEE